MKKFPKFYIMIVAFVIALQFFSLGFLVLVPTVSASAEGGIDIRNKVIVDLGSFNDLGTMDFGACSNNPEAKCWKIPWIAKYIGNMYRYGVTIGSILAVMMIVIGGVMYLIGGMNPAMISRGKELIVGAVTGLVLLLGSYLVLNTLNPNLVNMEAIEVEVLKEVKDTNVTFCDELEAGKYDIIGDNTCGQQMQYKAKDTTVVDEGSCIGSKCPEDGKKCVPATPTSTSDYACRSVLIWGEITDPKVRYVDWVQLYAIQGSGIGEKLAEVDTKQGDTSYYIYRENLTPEQLNKLNSIDSAILKIQLNDDGYDKLALTYGPGAADVISAGFGFLNVPIAADDDYYVGRDSKVHAGSDRFVGIWIKPDCTTCGGAHPTKKIAANRGEGWMFDTNCSYFWGPKIFRDGIRVDIDASNFREDSGIDCDMIKQVNPGGPKYEIDHECNTNDQCASSKCQKVNVGGIEKGKCVCKDNDDCKAVGGKCVSRPPSWNLCETCIANGASSPTDDACCSGYRNVWNVCACDDNTDCKTGEVCKKERTSSGSNECIQGVADLEGCFEDSDCISGHCHSSPGWYGTGSETSKCECGRSEIDKAGTCGPGKECVEVEDGCGWNYCIAIPGSVPSVPKNYNPLADTAWQDSFGLCKRNSSCKEGDCKIDWGVNNCNACGK